MNLPFFSSKKNIKDVFFGLFLKESQGCGYILVQDEHGVTVKTKKKFQYSDSWEHLTEDVDEILYKLEQETQCHVEKTIFFLFSHLIDESVKEIKRPYLQKIKELSKNLEFKPVGYIECHEAVASFLHDKESLALTSILVELDDTNIGVFVYKSGRKIRSIVVARTDAIIDDLISAFTTVGSNALLPNRLILYNSSSLIEESTSIITHKWPSELFAQMPRVEILNEADIVSGLVQVFEKQIETIESGVDEAPDAGAIKQKSVLGFLIGEDIGLMDSQSVAHGPRDESKKIIAPSEPFLKKSIEEMNKVGSFLMRTFKQMNIKLYGLVFGGIVLFIGIVFCLMFFFHKATILITLPTKTVERTVSTVEIPILIASSSMQLKDTKVTTGKKDIGDKAKGEVTLFNFDDTDKTFSKDTVLQADNIRFTLDGDVTVASSTLASDGSAKLPGKQKAKITAIEIGIESNLDKNKRFRIADLSTSVYFAMNDNAITGGTKKTLRTVSKKDLEDLKGSLLDKAKKNQQDKSTTIQNAGITFIDQLTDFQISNAKYSKEVGEEGDSLNLQATVTSKFYYFENDKVLVFLAGELEKDTPSGFKFETKNITYAVDKVTKKGVGTVLTLKSKAIAVKSSNGIEIMEHIKGSQDTEAQTYLSRQIGAIAVQIQMYPRVYWLSSHIPFFKRNIDLQIDSK
ncbi:hypothetical protein COY90_05585 [Candidatus Roizmanbacteria bacterium CG_4_10_14_0_8_um_filter_39_9]|uniref:Baseplate protein J-like domain-containing protein n=1 Tax=Candidatus Roizmanbacteria bacterium CG_4_10_14_0_8_um_filter_39_9 TaxID=1974829 RepID=A0A2M7QCC4_9BACT|nr:MAG: hypothetical protein COY90_05585 [Candidatus Roizmanbacteria bacterium CG_4_10_14_0_8_um_filter_39_9]